MQITEIRNETKMDRVRLLNSCAKKITQWISATNSMQIHGLYYKV